MEEIRSLEVDGSTEKGRQLMALLEDLAKKEIKPDPGVVICRLDEYPEIEDFIAEEHKKRSALVDELAEIKKRQREEKAAWREKFVKHNDEFFAELKPMLKAVGLMPEGYDEDKDNLEIKMDSKEIYYQKDANSLQVKI